MRAAPIPTKKPLLTENQAQESNRTPVASVEIEGSLRDRKGEYGVFGLLLMAVVEMKKWSFNVMAITPGDRPLCRVFPIGLKAHPGHVLYATPTPPVIAGLIFPISGGVPIIRYIRFCPIVWSGH